MPTVNDFVNAIATGNLANANTLFGGLMQDRLSQALDDKKIELAQGILGVADVSTEEGAEEESTLEDNENAEVSGVS